MRFDVGGPLNRTRVREIFERDGVDPHAYNLDGAHEPEAYVLTVRAGGWATFYSERGDEVGRREFATEDEACADLLERVLRDPTTRRHTT